MNVMRYTIIDRRGGVSFIAHCDAIPALVAACVKNPQSLEGMLDLAEPYYSGLSDYISSGLALFDEHNVPGNYDVIHQALKFCPPENQPVFRIVDDATREASLRPVKAGAIIFNLVAKRIIQVQNNYREIKRMGRAYVFDGRKMTSTTFSYRLPAEWSLVP